MGLIECVNQCDLRFDESVNDRNCTNRSHVVVESADIAGETMQEKSVILAQSNFSGLINDHPHRVTACIVR